ncbi:MAG: hypothetical protein DME19_20385, partial [Verrucomicrobia bacterium]
MGWLSVLIAVQPLTPAQASPPTPAGFRQDRVLVKPRPGTDLTVLHAGLGVTVLRSFPGIGNLQIVQLPPGASLASVLGAYQQSGLVQYAESDYLVRASLEPNDFRYGDGSLWGLHNTGIYGGVAGADINAPEGWDAQNTAPNIVVAVIDTGVRYTHEDLAANMWVNPGESGPGLLGVDKSINGIDDDGDGYVDDVHGINAILGTGVPWDDYGHGTHVSGTLGGLGNNSVGIVGVAWRVQIMACKFLDATGQGSISDAITCIDYARKKGAKIINASWGGYTFNSTALYDAISSARSAGILFVAATGNDNNDNDVNPLYPASYDLDNIIAVAATDRTDNRAWFSNYGARTVDLGAPGAAIFSCWNGSDSDYRYLDGTSMAAPHVVGVCALLWAHYPNDTYLQVKNRVLSNIDPLPALAGRTVTGGRLNLQKALGGSAPPPALTADFTADPTSGQAPLTVVFSDKSIGNPIAWDWDFGDGSAHSSAQNTSHTYNNAGDFTVVLTVAGGNGATSAKSQTIHATSPVPSPLPLPLPLGGTTATGQRPAPVSMISYDTPGDPVLDSSQFHLRVSGAPGERYVVEASPNLVDWMPVFTNAVSTFGFYDFTDTTSGTLPQRFYRAKPMAGGPIVLGEADYRNDRILVRPLAGVDLSVLHVLLGTRVLQTFPAIGNLEIVQLPAGAIVDNILALFRQSGLVQYAERDFQVQGLLAPNDFRYQDNSLWGLHNTGIYGGTPGADIHAQDAWDVQNTASNIIVAVIDTGVRYTHEDLADNMWVNPGETGGNGVDDDGDGYVDDVHGINAINNTGDPNDDHGHGTHVSGTIGGVGNNAVGVVGVAWKVQIMACKFLDASGIGFISDAIKCIDYARSQGARVVNASWGSTSFSSSALRDAIDSLRQAGIIFVAAAGNSAEDNGVDPIYPASYDLDNIISVAATTRTDELANFSNYGSTTVDLGAPGAAIFSCWNGADNDYKYFDGTSMAAPHVTGTCALLMAHYPGESYQQIINRILSNVDPLPSLAGKCVSGGRLDLQKALGGSPPPPPPEKPTVVVAATDANASEQGPDSGSFTITRAGDTSSALTVNYSLGGTAQNGIDYQQVETSVTIGAGSGSATVTITPIDDNEM